MRSTRTAAMAAAIVLVGAAASTATARPTPLRRRRPRPRRPSTPTARTRSARTSSRAGTARQAPSATARATGNASTGPTSSTTRCPRRRRTFRSSRPIYGVHDERVPAMAAHRRPLARPGEPAMCSASGPTGADRCRQPRGASAEQSLTVSESFPYTRSTVIAISTLRSDTITARYSSQSGCSPAALR